jgi:hypothetical protein
MSSCTAKQPVGKSENQLLMSLNRRSNMTAWTKMLEHGDSTSGLRTDDGKRELHDQQVSWL